MTLDCCRAIHPQSVVIVCLPAIIALAKFIARDGSSLPSISGGAMRDPRDNTTGAIAGCTCMSARWSWTWLVRSVWHRFDKRGDGRIAAVALGSAAGCGAADSVSRAVVFLVR
jgi:hypothetical protein